MKNLYIFILFFIFASQSLSAQPFQYYEGKEAYNWIFGDNVKLNFNFHAQYPNVSIISSFSTHEASGTISNKKGKLMFYVGCCYIRDSNSIPLQTVYWIKSNSHTTQGALLFNFPYTDYYHFVSIWAVSNKSKVGNDNVRGGNSANWPGFSGVHIMSNIANHQSYNKTIENTKYATEGMASFYSFKEHKYRIANLIYGKHIIINKMDANVKIDSFQAIDFKIKSLYNFIKFSPDGRYLALSNIGMYRVNLYKLNSDNTYIHYKEIKTDYDNTSIEFSPNCKYMYIAHSQIDGINQYDIENDKLIKLTDVNTWIMQLGPDGRIYSCDTKMYQKTLSIIKYPNRKGLAAMYEAEALDLLGGSARYGLPNFPSNLFYYTNGAVEILAKDTVCAGESFTLTPVFNEKGMAIDSIEWVGPKGLISRTDTVVTIDRMTKADKGRYTFYVYVGDERFRAYHDVLLVADSIDLSITYKDKLEFCEGDTITLSANKDYHSYEWSNGKTTKSIQVTEAGSYSLRVYNSVGCDDIDSVEVKTYALPQIAFDVPSVLCQGSEIELKTKQQYKKYKWSTGDSTSSIIVSKSGTYSLEVENEIGCQTSKEILLNFAPKIDLQILGNSTFCTGGFAKIITNLSENDYDFEWSNGENTNEKVYQSEALTQ